MSPFIPGAASGDVLYDKGTRFRVLSKTYDPELDRWMVHLQEVTG